MRRLLPIAIVALLAACTFNPDLGDEYFPCKPDGTCPGECECLDGQVCVHRDVLDPGYCAWCEVPCDDPPPPTCDGDDLIIYLDAGDCVYGQCRYQSSNKPCAHGCENGACKDDPCVDVICNLNQHCDSSSGQCVCDDLYGDCDTNSLNGCETYLNTIEDCGVCERTCGQESICVEGECDCKYGFGNCNDNWGDGCEEDVLHNNLHCGTCGDGCDPGLTCCNGSCVDTDTDRGNCGRCNMFCIGMTECCLGICTETQLDEENCGFCGNVCPDLFGTCCWGSCVDLATDDQNCGECNNACALNIPCHQGGCGAQGIHCGSITCDFWEESCCYGTNGIACYPSGECTMRIVECDDDEDCGDFLYCCLIDRSQFITQCTSSCPSMVCSSDEYCRVHDPDNPHCCSGDFDGQLVNLCQSELCQ